MRSCGVPPQKFGGEPPPLPQAATRLRSVATCCSYF